MLKIVVCVSGGGTNLQAIMDGVASGSIRDTEIIGIMCNNAGAYAMERAKAAGIPAKCVSAKDYADRADFNADLLKEIDAWQPDLIVLAGYLVNIPPAMVQAYPGRIINIHPSLIPSFCGVGHYGLKVHEKALERGVKVSGATVHFVDEGTDTGPILLQKAGEVKEGDTPKVLQQRIMEEAEWVILPKAIDLIAQGKVTVTDGKVHIRD